MDGSSEDQNSDTTKQKRSNYEGLVLPTQRHELCPIWYIYDYLPSKISWLRPQRVAVPEEILRLRDAEDARSNSIQLLPALAGLPIHTGMVGFRQSKHWESSIRASTELLELFAEDERCKEITLQDGRSMASWAQGEKARQVSESVIRFAIYMLPDASEERMYLLGEAVILIFLFDGEQISGRGGLRIRLTITRSVGKCFCRSGKQN